MKKLQKFFVFLFFGFIFLSFVRNIIDYKKNLDFYQGFKKEYESEKKNNISLKTQILKNEDPSEVEKSIRDKLNLAKKDETVIIVPSPTPTPTKISPTPFPIYLQWFSAFFKN